MVAILSPEGRAGSAGLAEAGVAPLGERRANGLDLGPGATRGSHPMVRLWASPLLSGRSLAVA